MAPTVPSACTPPLSFSLGAPCAGVAAVLYAGPPARCSAVTVTTIASPFIRAALALATFFSFIINNGTRQAYRIR